MPCKYENHALWKVLLLALLTLFSYASFAAEPLGIAYFAGSARSKIGALIMVDVYKRIGIEAVPLPLPGARNTIAAESSQVLGESVRVTSYTDAHPTLTRVEPAVTVWTTAAFYKKSSNTRIKSAEDLKNYRIGHVRGTRSAEDIVAAQELTKVDVANSTELLFSMLNLDRFDVAVEGGTNGNFVIYKNGYQDIQQVELNKIPLYHILSPKYKDLAPRLSTIIKQMAASGELEKIAARFEKEVVESGVAP